MPTLCVWALAALAGCHHVTEPAMSPEAFVSGTPLANPWMAPPVDREYLWQQVVDTVDDYFKIASEVRIRDDGGVLTDGRIHTHPEVGATYLEPWRKDSTTSFERLHATFQSVRKYAAIRVAPQESGYAIEVAVYKELEDVAQPEHATVDAATIRYDGSLIRNEANGPYGPPTLGWKPLGRDVFLEQQILAELQGRLADLRATSRLPAIPGR